MALAGKAVTRVVRRCHEGQQSEELDLSNCSLKSFPEAVYFLLRNTRLVSCTLQQNQICKLPAKFFFNFQHLTVLNVGSNRLCSLPDEISRMNELRVLDISKNRFSLFPNAVLANSRIEDILAEENEISDVDVDALERASPSLKEVNLQKNPLNGRLCGQLERLHDEGALTFYITYTPYTDNFCDVD